MAAIRSIAVALFFVSVFCIAGLAQICPGGVGCLDPSFGNGGIQYITGLGTGNVGPRDMAIQSDGKVVALVEGSATSATLIRLNTNGSLDNTLAGDGILETNWHYSSTLPSGYPFGLAIQVIGGEERFVVVGSWSVSAGRHTQYNYRRIDRYRADGSVDTSFGAGTGTVLLNIGSGAQDVAIESDNKIVVVGGDSVFRLNENGTLDTSFGQNGAGITGAGQQALSVKLLSDGSILVGGTYSSNQGDLMCVTRLNYNGSINTSFGNAGRAVVNFYGRGSAGRANKVDLDPFGNIIAGGWARPKNASISDNRFAAARFTLSGQPDISFNGTGMVTFALPSSPGGSAASIVAQSDGKLILSGDAMATDDMASVRFNYNGSVDITFGSGGSVLTYVDRNEGLVSSALWLDPTCSCQKLIITGYAYSGVAFARSTTQ
jgi:uncharacterized delta-60 repeat protein